MPRASILLAGIMVIGWIGLLPASAASGWKYEVVPNDGHVLTYSEDGKVTFYLGCGRGFALQVKYPGEAKKARRALRYRAQNPEWRLRASSYPPSRSKIQFR